MSRTRILAAAAALLVAAAGVAVVLATGGDDNPDFPPAATEEAAPEGERQGSQAGGGGEGSGKGRGGSAESEDDPLERIPPTEVEQIDPPPVPEGGDDSIHTFGGEADEAEAQAVASALAGFLAARAAGRWKVACALMASGFDDQLAGLGAQAQEETEDEEAPTLDCPTFLRSTAGGLPKQNLRKLARVRLGSVRTEGARAFAIYKSGYPHWVFMPMVREEGGWRVAALDSSPLP